MSTPVAPEYIKVKEDVDIKMEPLEVVPEPILRTDIFDNDLEADIPDLGIKSISKNLICPLCHTTFEILSQIEDHLFYEQCIQPGSSVSQEPEVIYTDGTKIKSSVTYCCQFPQCPSFKSPLKSTLVLHYLETHLKFNEAVNGAQSSTEATGRNLLKINTVFPCTQPGCGLIFDKAMERKIHKFNDHQLMGEDVVDPIPFWTCEHCDFISIAKNKMDSHTKKSHANLKPRPPPKPRNSKKNMNGVGAGFRKYFEEIPRDPNFVDFFTCLNRECVKRFPQLCQLKKHMEVDHQTFAFKRERKRYKKFEFRITNKSNMMSLCRCKICGWIGGFWDFGATQYLLKPHLKKVHNQEYFELMTQKKGIQIRDGQLPLILTEDA